MAKMTKAEREAKKAAYAAAVAAGEKKARKKGVVRKQGNLKTGSLHERMFGAIRIILNLGKKNLYAGTEWADVKYAPAYPIYKNGGRYWGLAEDGETFKSLRSAVSAAVSDTSEGKYTPAVQKAVTATLSIPGAGGGGGSRGTNYASIKDFKF